MSEETIGDQLPALIGAVVTVAALAIWMWEPSPAELESNPPGDEIVRYKAACEAEIKAGLRSPASAVINYTEETKRSFTGTVDSHIGNGTMERLHFECTIPFLQAPIVVFKDMSLDARL